MAISDAKVEKIVNDAITLNNNFSTKKTAKEVIKEAWQVVNYRRLSGNCDIDLSAAEHYLFCRVITAIGGHVTYLVIMGMKGVYDLGKLADLSYKEGTCPVSPVSKEDWYWSHEGAKDGIDDFFGKYSRQDLRCRNRYYYNKYMEELERLGY